jgi:hypothetical protein
VTREVVPNRYLGRSIPNEFIANTVPPVFVEAAPALNSLATRVKRLLRRHA